MIKIKFEVNDEEEEEKVTPLPIENENDRLLSMNFFNNNNLTSSLTNLNNVTSIDNSLPKKPKPKQLDNSTTDSVAFVSKSIKTEQVESSLLLTTQLNNSLNIQSLLRQNLIQNGWTTNESTSSIGTKQQQQSFPLPKIEPIVPEIHQEVPLSLDLNSLIPNLDFEESSNYDTAKPPSLVQCASIPIRTQQQQSLLVPKNEPIVSEIHQEVPLSLDLSSLIPNLNFGESTTTNCDITTEMFPGPRAGRGRRAKLNVCYSVPMEPESVPRRRKKLPKPTFPFPQSADNSELASNDNDQHSGSGSISGLDPSTSSTTAQVAAPSPPPNVVPLLVGKKPLRRVPPLTLEEKKAHKREIRRLWYLRQKANPEVMDEMRRRGREYERKYRQKRLASATPEQLELRKMKGLEKVRRHLEKETEEQRQLRLERGRQYDRTVRKQRREQKQRQTSTSTLTNNSNGIGDIGTTISKRKKRKPDKKRFELSMDDSDSFHFDIDGGGGGNGDEESNSQIILEPGPSKLTRPPRCQRNLKSQIYLEPSTDSDDSD